MDRMGVLSCSAHGWNKGIPTRPRNLKLTEKFAANANGWNFKVNWLRMERRVELVDVR